MIHYELSFFHTFLINFMFAIFVLLEPLRLWLGHSGNLRERVPELAGCFLFSLFPQFVISFYFLQLQPLTGWGFTHSLEFALNLVYLAFLIPQILGSYVAARHIVRMQTAHFFLKSDYQHNSLVNKDRPQKRRTSLSWNSLESFW